jgi:Lrp/AsnC family transcriptional regulator for asnA, asnC and gidA
MKFDPTLKLDSTDKSIISLLSGDSSASDSKIAKTLSISPNTVRVRIKKMIENKLILGFRLFINPSKIDYHSHMVFLEINKLDPNTEQALFNYAKSIPNVTFFVRHIGRWRIGMEIESKTEAEFQEIFVNIRTKFSGLISGFESFPIYSDRVINYFPSGNLTQPI